MKGMKQKLAVLLTMVLLTSGMSGAVVSAAPADVSADAVETAAEETQEEKSGEEEKDESKETKESGKEEESEEMEQSGKEEESEETEESGKGDESEETEQSGKEDESEETGESGKEEESEETEESGGEDESEETGESGGEDESEETEQLKEDAEDSEKEEESEETESEMSETEETETVESTEDVSEADEGISPFSLLPLDEKEIECDLKSYTPVELTMVPFSVIFAGESLRADKISYAESYSDDYKVSAFSGTANVSCDSRNGGGYWEMIPGGDQLNAGAKRYIVNLKMTDSDKWITPEVYIQNEAGSRVQSTASGDYYDYDMDDRELRVKISGAAASKDESVYLKLNVDNFGGRIASLRAYEGNYTTADAAKKGTEITNQIFCTDMTKRDAGYKVYLYGEKWITFVSYDSGGNVTGCLPFYLYVSRETENTENNEIRTHSMFRRTGSDREYVVNSYSHSNENGCETETCELYEGYAVNGMYCMTMSYYQQGKQNNGAVTAAYAGARTYASIGEAKNAGAVDAREALFGGNYSTEGYAADYSAGVYFSIFIGADGTPGQEVYHYCIRTKEGIIVKNSGADVRFTGLLDANGNRVKCYIIKSQDDSYAERSYPTILVDNNVDLTKLIPIFTTSTGVRLYAGATPNDNTVQTSGKSMQDFSKGPVQYTTASENKENQKNCWLSVIKTDSVIYRLFTNSLMDKDAGTYIDENGVIRSKREVILRDVDDGHDIFLTNMGTTAIPKLSVSINCDALKIDEYWTLNGNHDLAAFSGTDTDPDKPHGELSNLAKIRLKSASGVVSGAEITGTLTIRSEGKDIMILELTGIAGMPEILTDSIPEAVKYVPYGIMIQNSNKYSSNKITYILDGDLPSGMELRPNGEIYGVPKETGEFDFEVRMVCSKMPDTYDRKYYTLVVKENTDENVDGATDTGYTVTQRIPNLALGATDDHTFVSTGVLGEYRKVFLDGEELSPNEYRAESGSTRLTINSQTLMKSNTKGVHTLGVEFRTSEDTLKRAAQNFYVTEGSSDDNGGSGSHSGHGSKSGGGSGSGTTGTVNTAIGDSLAGVPDTIGDGSIDIPVSDDAAGLMNGADFIIYTVKAGDTLWKIAAEFYGDGAFWKKIYEDNKDVISNPNIIYVGQELKIYLSPTGTIVPGMDVAEGDVTTYTVQPGDTLWKISKKVYGISWKWKKIYEANTDVISDPGMIYVGQVIVIP